MLTAKKKKSPSSLFIRLSILCAMIFTANPGPVTITDSVFLIDGTFLQLDLSLNVGPYAVITPWSHTEDIGTLPAGLYDLTVRTLEDSLVTDTYPTPFEVVPEPTTFVLFGLGGLLLRNGENLCGILTVKMV